MIKDRQQVRFTSVDQLEFSWASQDQTRYWDDDVWKELGIGGFSLDLTESKRKGGSLVWNERILSAAWMKRLRSLLHHLITYMQNSEECSQEWNSIFFSCKIKEKACWAEYGLLPQQLNFAVWCTMTGCGISWVSRSDW